MDTSTTAVLSVLKWCVVRQCSKPLIYVTDQAFEYSAHRHGEVRGAGGRSAARWRKRKAGGRNRPGRAKATEATEA